MTSEGVPSIKDAAKRAARRFRDQAPKDVEEPEALASGASDKFPHHLEKVDNDKTITWDAGTPDKPGTYVVAILYENGLGTISVDRYNMERGWSSDDHIIAYIPFRDVLDTAGVEWPEHLTPK